jgi:hypothetical protein
MSIRTHKLAVLILTGGGLFLASCGKDAPVTTSAPAPASPAQASAKAAPASDDAAAKPASSSAKSVVVEPVAQPSRASIFVTSPYHLGLKNANSL